MNTFSQKWFYQNPGIIPHNIAETVRQSLWSSGLYSIWLDTVNTSAPYKLIGQHSDVSIELEWQPSRWLRLRSEKDILSLRNHLSWLLGFESNLQFTDHMNWQVNEWHLQEFDERWREISGNPMYSSPIRFD
jgi:hypothetical protein